MINNALPDAFDDHHHALSWRPSASAHPRESWTARLRQIAAQVAAWFRTRVFRRHRAAPLPAPKESPEEQLSPEDLPQRAEPPQWPTKLLDVADIPSEAVQELPPPSHPPSLRPPPTTGEPPSGAPSPQTPRRRHVIVTLPPPDFEAGPDYDPQPPPQGFSREAVLLDEAAAKAGRLQVLRRLPGPTEMPRRIRLQEEPLVMLLPPQVKAVPGPTAGVALASADESAAPPPQAPPPAPSPVAPPNLQPEPPRAEPSARMGTPAPASLARVRVPVRRKIITLSRPETPLIVPRQAAPAVAVERPLQDHSIEDEWIGEAKVPAPAVETPERRMDRAGSVRNEATELVEAIEWTASDLPAAVAETPLAEAAPHADPAMLLPGGDPEPELRFDLPLPEEPLYGEGAGADAIRAVLDDTEALTFDSPAEEESPPPIERPAEMTVAPAEALLQPAAMEEDWPAATAVISEMPEATPPPAELAPVLDIQSDSSAELAIEWSGQVAEEDEIVVSPSVLLDAPAEGAALVAGLPDTPRLAATEPAELTLPARPHAASRVMPLKRVLRRVVYIQDGAVLPLSARRLRRTMANVYLSPSARSRQVPASSAPAPVPGPSTEAFHDDGL